MKKNYTKPSFEEIKIETNIFCGSLPNSNWTTDENGNTVNPGGHTPPGHNKDNKPAAEYRTDLWE